MPLLPDLPSRSRKLLEDLAGHPDAATAAAASALARGKYGASPSASASRYLSPRWPPPPPPKRHPRHHARPSPPLGPATTIVHTYFADVSLDVFHLSFLFISLANPFFVSNQLSLGVDWLDNCIHLLLLLLWNQPMIDEPATHCNSHASSSSSYSSSSSSLSSQPISLYIRFFFLMLVLFLFSFHPSWNRHPTGFSMDLIALRHPRSYPPPSGQHKCILWLGGVFFQYSLSLSLSLVTSSSLASRLGTFWSLFHSLSISFSLHFLPLSFFPVPAAVHFGFVSVASFRRRAATRSPVPMQ